MKCEKMEEKLISIIVPVYNIRAYLPRCVESVLAKQETPLELLLIDDGSTDGSGALCDELAEKDERVAVYHKPNGGLSDARNYGLARAKGEYLLFLDGDDALVEGACASLMQDARKTQADIVVGKVHFVEPDSIMEQWEERLARDAKLHTVYTGKEYLMISLCSSDLRVEVGRHLYRTAFLRENGLEFQKGILHEDEEFTPRALLAAQCLVMTDQVVYHYENRRPGSIMNSDALSARRAADKLRICEELGQIYAQVTPRKLRRRLQDNLCWKYLDCEVRFDCTTLPGYHPQRWKMLCYAYTSRRRAKALLFALSPRLFRALMRHQRGQKAS